MPCVGTHYSTWLAVPGTALAQIKKTGGNTFAHAIRKAIYEAGAIEIANVTDNYAVLATRLHTDARPVGNRMPPLWQPLQMMVRGPGPHNAASLCHVEGWLAPTPELRRIESVALRALRKRGEACTETGGEPARTHADTCATIKRARSVQELCSQYTAEALPMIAQLLLATQVLASSWKDGGTKFRDRMSRREAEAAFADACRALVEAQLASNV